MIKRRLSFGIAGLALTSLLGSGCLMPTMEKKYLTRHEFSGDHSVKYIYHYKSDFSQQDGVDTDYALEMRVCDVDQQSTEGNCKDSTILKSVP